MKRKNWVKNERTRGWENKEGKIRDEKWKKIKEWGMDGYRMEMRKQGSEKMIKRKDEKVRKRNERLSRSEIKHLKRWEWW